MKRSSMIILMMVFLTGCQSEKTTDVKEPQTEMIQEQNTGEETSQDKISENEQTDETDAADEQDLQRLDYIDGFAEKNMDRDVVGDAIRENTVTSNEDQIVKAIYVMEMKTSIMVLYWEQPSQNGYTIYHAFGSGSDKKVKADAEVSLIEDDLIKYVQYFDGKEFYEMIPGYFADSENIEEAVWFYIDVTDRMNEKYMSK
ncbi:MAG: hypothetical protein IK123_04545 [Lachnospiraceae bacterium]|nr:hypothetical protein [Lachnospiraceae bacterium]